MRRSLPVLLVLLVLVLLLAGCGKSKPKASTTTATVVVGPATVLGKGAKVIYQSSTGWAVVVDGSQAVAAHLVKGEWRADRTGQVKVEILGSTGPQGPQPQVAAQLISKTPLVESSIWVDGVVIQVQGGGTPTRGTIYGQPAAPLFPGKHLEVAYARTATHGTAVARVFTVVSN